MLSLGAAEEKNLKSKTAYKYVILDIVFELSSVCISIADVVSDVLITVSFYEGGQLDYFWTSITILCLAQLAYTGLFVILYGGHYYKGDLVLLFCLILPVAQLVPAVVWAYPKFAWLRRLMARVNLAPSLPPVYGSEVDPLYVAIRKKIKVHGGFIVESLVESIPQSILQMVAIVQTGVTPALSVFSIVMSMSSVASRGFMLSYSVDRPTFVFQFLCFVADVFSIFCTVSWLCFVVPGEPRFSVFWNNDGPRADFLSSLWFQKDILLVATILLYLLSLLFFYSVNKLATRWRQRVHTPTDWLACCRGTVDCLKVSCFLCRLCGCGGICGEVVVCPCTKEAWKKRGRFCWKLTRGLLIVILLMIGALLGIAVAVSPAIIIFEGVRFSLIPLVFMSSMSAPRSSRYPAFRALYDFLEHPRGDFIGRLRVTNKYLANMALMGTAVPAMSLEYERSTKVFNRIQVSRRILAMKDDQFTVRAVRHANGNYLWRYVKDYLGAVSGGPLQASKMEMFALGYLTYLLLPLAFLVVVYSIVYPIISFIRTPIENMLAIQLVLTCTYMAILVALLLLSYHVYKFYRVNACLLLNNVDILMPWVNAIKDLYEQTQQRKLARSELSAHLPSVVAELVVDYLPAPQFQMQALAEQAQAKVDTLKRKRKEERRRARGKWCCWNTQAEPGGGGGEGAFDPSNNNNDNNNDDNNNNNNNNVTTIDSSTTTSSGTAAGVANVNRYETKEEEEEEGLELQLDAY